MRPLLDQGLPRSAVRHLAGMGIFVEHAGDLGLAKAADRHILDVARERQATVVTLDADFHAFIQHPLERLIVLRLVEQPPAKVRGDWATSLRTAGKMAG